MKRNVITIVVVLVVIIAIIIGVDSKNRANQSQTGAASEEPVVSGAEDKHLIAVPVYDIGDSQVIAFRQYLEEYIESCYPDVKFLYSSSLTSQEQLMTFLQTAINAGAEGVMSFQSYDLPAEVELCAANEVYYIRASATVATELFDQVADNPYFLGTISLGVDSEYQAGVDLANYFLNRKDGNSYLIVSGGAGMGNAMHFLRTKAILETLESSYGFKFDVSTDDLANTSEIVEIENDKCKVKIMPGYFGMGTVLDDVNAEIAAGNYQYLLSVTAAEVLAPAVNTSSMEFGTIDCYTQDNQIQFTNGILDFVAGKFASTIGPSFMAVYNAINGDGDTFRDNGKAFRLSQAYWTSDTVEDYNEKYVYSSGIEVNAYNYEDLNAVCKKINPNATFEDFKALVEASSFEDVVARRGH